MPERIEIRLARELAVHPGQVEAAVALLDGGATVPFVARYRKEATGGLDDAQLRQLNERLGYLRELDARRISILTTLADLGQQDPELLRAIDGADTKQRLEDLYLPFKPKRRTKASQAREAGLGELAESLLKRPHESLSDLAARFINPELGIESSEQALEGARHILIETISEEAELVGRLRDLLRQQAILVTRVIPGQETSGAKFSDYFAHSEPLRSIPSHRLLAILRARNDEVIKLYLTLDAYDPTGDKCWGDCLQRIAHHFQCPIQDAHHPSLADPLPLTWLHETIRQAWKTRLRPHLETDILAEARERAEGEAIRIFARNLKDLLLAAPAGSRTTLGIDPGLRTGCKLAVVDSTGKLLDTATMYPHEPRRDRLGALATLSQLCERHQVELIAIGNGTASRETEALVDEWLKNRSNDLPSPKPVKVIVSEAGASVYSASELASAEFPDIDVSLRGAISIARRLQDPLAELVKIDPKSIGVGQYQHDVSQPDLSRALSAVVEDCVNGVGVEINTASESLLTHVSGLNPTLARNIVAFRNQNGSFIHREQLRKVPRLGPKAFEQAAGFLRIRDGQNPLDASGVHPEAYPVVEKMLERLQKQACDVIGNLNLLKSLRASDFTSERFGLPTVSDILSELEKPGRDPRPEFKTARFRADIATLADLTPGMILEGVITNVAAFGAFVDIGVHQDGLVHVSALSERFVRDPHQVVKAGDIVQVKVLEVDAVRRRISLTMRLNDNPASSTAPHKKREHTPKSGPAQPQKQSLRPPQQPSGRQADGALAQAFARLKERNPK